MTWGSAGYVLCDAPELLKNAQAMFENAEAGRVPSLPHQQILNLKFMILQILCSYGRLPFITGDFNGVIHSINGVWLVLITDK